MLRGVQRLQERRRAPRRAPAPGCRPGRACRARSAPPGRAARCRRRRSARAPRRRGGAAPSPARSRRRRRCRCRRGGGEAASSAGTLRQVELGPDEGVIALRGACLLPAIAGVDDRDVRRREHEVVAACGGALAVTADVRDASGPSGRSAAMRSRDGRDRVPRPRGRRRAGRGRAVGRGAVPRRRSRTPSPRGRAGPSAACWRRCRRPSGRCAAPASRATARAWRTLASFPQRGLDAGGRARLATATRRSPAWATAWSARSGDGTSSTAAASICHGGRARRPETYLASFVSERCGRAQSPAASTLGERGEGVEHRDLLDRADVPLRLGEQLRLAAAHEPFRFHGRSAAHA